MTEPERPSLPTSYFEDIYASDPDPWRFETSRYEQDKYDATLAVLPPRIARCFEVGCANGVLTRRLADRCEALLAVDVAEAALAQARRRCGDCPHVRIERRRIPADWPLGETFDLVVLSEVLYYLSATDLALAARRTRESLAPGGTALLVHYTPPTDYPLSGDAAAEGFAGVAGLKPVLQRRADRYRLDLLQR